MTTITFFDKKKDYRPLSNFYECTIAIEDSDGSSRVYATGEHAFHGEKYRRIAKKVTDVERVITLTQYAARFLLTGNIVTAKDAKQKGGKRGLRLTVEELRIWDELCIDVQREICRYKMNHYDDVKHWLRLSGDNILVHPAMRCSETKVKSRMWEGRAIVDAEGKTIIIGGNKLGEIWMEIRLEMLNAE